MSQHALETQTRSYFQRVMHDWKASMETTHPYSHNRVWQRNYLALRKWIADYGLTQGRVLEVGCGTGLLQHLAPNYIGTDLAVNSASYMYQPFCACSATKLPFVDNSFDGAWSVWVLEHIEHPEEMLAEMRRVVKPGGTIFIRAAYAVDSWVSQGVHKRPFGDLTWRQRLVKLSIPIRSNKLYKIVTTLPLRVFDMSRYLHKRQPTKLRYRKLQPNYDTYWDYDADACVSLDAYSIALYFLSRGDQPCYSEGLIRGLLRRSQPQAYIIRK